MFSNRRTVGSSKKPNLENSSTSGKVGMPVPSISRFQLHRTEVVDCHNGEGLSCWSITDVIVATQLSSGPKPILTILLIVNEDYSLAIPKNRRPIFPDWRNGRRIFGANSVLYGPLLHHRCVTVCPQRRNDNLFLERSNATERFERFISQVKIFCFLHYGWKVNVGGSFIHLSFVGRSKLKRNDLVMLVNCIQIFRTVCICAIIQVTFVEL